jgi:hypothetical protein
LAAGVALKLGYQSSAARIKISLSTTVPVIAAGTDLGQPEMRVTAVNRGIRPVRIETTGIALPSGATMAFMGLQTTPRLPTTLRAGETVSWTVTYRELAATLRGQGLAGPVKIRPYYRDTLQNMYGVAWGFNSSRW